MKNDTEEKLASEDNDSVIESAEFGSEVASPAGGQASQDETGHQGSTDLYEQIEGLQAEISEHKERYLRTVADMENLRKRFAREKEDIRRRATSALIEDLLPALDNLRMGLNAADSHPEAAEIVKGLNMVISQFKQILGSHGLEAVEPEPNSEFDPNLHESVAVQPSDSIAEQHIISVMRIGYKLNEHLIRAASVVVSSGQAAAENDQPNS